MRVNVEWNSLVLYLHLWSQVSQESRVLFAFKMPDHGRELLVVKLFVLVLVLILLVPLLPSKCQVARAPLHFASKPPVLFVLFVVERCLILCCIFHA